MWYVIQVRTGTEESIRTQCQKKIENSILENCFIPYYEEKKHIRGEWTTKKKVLFPGYVFLVSEKIEDLFEKLKIVIGYTRLLGAGDTIVPLKQEEVEFLKNFGGEEQVVPVSCGVIEGGKTMILSGPLKGMEGYIKKIDRHKRKARIEIELFERRQQVEVGLEIVAKSE